MNKTCLRYVHDAPKCAFFCISLENWILFAHLIDNAIRVCHGRPFRTHALSIKSINNLIIFKFMKIYRKPFKYYVYLAMWRWGESMHVLPNSKYLFTFSNYFIRTHENSSRCDFNTVYQATDATVSEFVDDDQNKHKHKKHCNGISTNEFDDTHSNTYIRTETNPMSARRKS